MVSNPDQRVFIVDDDALVRSSLEEILKLAGFSPEKFISGESFLSSFTEHWSGCLLVDVHMPGMTGLELQEELVRRNAAIAVIVMTGNANVPLAVRAVSSGALDVLEKPFRREDLLGKVSRAIAIAEEKQSRIANIDAMNRQLNLLTEREQTIFREIAIGGSNKEIARRTKLSTRTVENHRAKIMQKLQVGNLAGLVRIAEKLSLLD